MKIGIVTIIDNNNLGNRLQNFALQKFLSIIGIYSETLINDPFSNTRKFYFIRKLKNIFYRGTYSNNYNRKKSFENFNNLICFSKKKINAYSKNLNYDYFICGSDQIWNPTFGRLRDVDLLLFCSNYKRISYAASFGVGNIDYFVDDILIESFNSFKSISVREDAGKKIINDILPDKEVEVLIDPTMLLTADEWDKVSLKPKMLKCEKFILNYFLGDLSESKRKEIERIAKEHDCEIINILDKNSPFYECGPSEFLWLEKHAYLICTDSFHSSVFAVLYNRPFIIFDREQEGMAKMNSRLDTLISKFNLKNRKFEGKITEENLNHDYSEAYEILEAERQKSKDFLERALDIKK